MKRVVRSVCGSLLLTFLFWGHGWAQSLSAAETYEEAYERGFQDGQQAGREDRQQEHLFDLANKQSFQRADLGFNESRHDREVYPVAYRKGFEDGYQEGYGLVGQDLSSPVSPAVDSVRDLQDSSVILPAGTRIKVRLLDTLSTRHNERGDTFQVEVAEDVMVGQQLAIPELTLGNVVIASLKRAGRIKGRASMNFRFEDLEFFDGTRVPIEGRIVSIEKRDGQEVRDEEGTVQAKGTKSSDARKMGTSSALGALIGVLTGGRRGAATGAAVGAAVGAAGVLISRGRDLNLDLLTEMTIELDQDVEIPLQALEP